MSEQKRKKVSWGIASIIAAFVYPPFGSIVGFIIGLISYSDEDDSLALAVCGMVFSLATFIIFGGMWLWAVLT